MSVTSLPLETGMHALERRGLVRLLELILDHARFSPRVACTKHIHVIVPLYDQEPGYYQPPRLAVALSPRRVAGEYPHLR